MKAACVIIVAMFVAGIASGFCIAQVMSVNHTSTRFSNSGIVGTVTTVGVEAYYDAALTTRVTSVTWGTINPGESQSVTIYVCNNGNSAVTLSQVASNWSPASASSCIWLTWDYNGQALAAGQTVKLTLTLSVASDASGVGSFGFDTTITGTTA